MKYLKLFEEILQVNAVLGVKIHSDNTNINELKESFISDINDICLELGDIYPTRINFYNSHSRKKSVERDRQINTVYHYRFKLEYPSISISESKWRSIYGWEDDSRIWTRACIDTANRIKDYLGDSYKLFLYTNNGTSIITLKADLFEPVEGFKKWGGTRISGFEIVYDPKDYIK